MLHSLDGAVEALLTTLNFMRVTNFQFRTAFSAWVVPPLRQTASCVAGILIRIFPVIVFSQLQKLN
jgi:hypothetical protein